MIIMSDSKNALVSATSYDRASCEIGIVHLGFGAFHRAHQAVYIDEYMEQSGDHRWGIAAVNLRGSESASFASVAAEIAENDGYYLKAISADGIANLQKIRAHVGFFDWAVMTDESEALLSSPKVHLVTITVTESGYYIDPNGEVDIAHPLMKQEIAGIAAQSCYAYLRAALHQRMSIIDQPLTIACCDNIRKNGKMLRRNLLAYLSACGDEALHDWVAKNVAFPCSMVDRITPRSPASLSEELTKEFGKTIAFPVMSEDFIQWVLSDEAKGPMPDLAQVGVTLTDNVDPYEETKIRVLNGGHTATAYLAALEGVLTFDECMRHPELLAHFDGFEKDEVLTGLTLDLPFSKADYLAMTASRFGNQAIGDTVARICADGMAKFPIFIRPTLEGCFQQGVIPAYAIRSIASWYVFARHVQAGKISFEYIEPSWQSLVDMLGDGSFFNSRQLWGEVPEAYPAFGTLLQQEISLLEAKWPI